VKCSLEFSAVLLCFCDSLLNQRVVIKVAQRHLVPRAGYGAYTVIQRQTSENRAVKRCGVLIEIEKISIWLTTTTTNCVNEQSVK